MKKIDKYYHSDILIIQILIPLTQNLGFSVICDVSQKQLPFRGFSEGISNP
jgi:hypothetical protein